MRTLPLTLFICALASQVAGQSPDIPVSGLPLHKAMFDDGQDPMKVRLFRTTSTRTQIDLGGWWDFVTDPEDKGETQGWAARFPEPETRLWVPGTWNTVARYWHYTGPAWYERRFEIPGDANLRIVFGSVFYHSKVWLDGRLLGEHEGGYLPFSFTLPGLKKGGHTLVVRADNRLSDRTLPKRNVDWFPYGGIERPVYAELVPAVFIDRLRVTPAAITPARATLKVSVEMQNLGTAAETSLAFSVNGGQPHVRREQVPAGKSTVEFEVPLDGPRLWSPGDPVLYSARAVLGDRSDDQFTRFGVRTITVEGSSILLNGSRIKLLGANRHEDHPDWGSSSPPNMVRQDVEILQRLGANAVRAHYPVQELFLDFCDQYGFLFMAEVPSWQYSAQQLQDAAIQDKILAAMSAMIERDANHPSILTWSLGNEWPEPDRSYDVVRSLVKRTRKLDSTRLITFVTGGPRLWRVQELVDVICVNWARYQWYDPFTVLDRKEGDRSVADLAKIHERYPAKPVILTEFGGAESQAGWHNWGNVKWSEEFQAVNVEDSAVHALETDWISGGCVWQFCDTRTAPERYLAGRIHGWNGKGVVDAHRNPKLAFYRLQQVFRSQARAGAGATAAATQLSTKAPGARPEP